MKRFIASILLALLLSAPVLMAQTAKYTPDSKAITAAVSDKAAYKALADRFATGQTLSTDDMAALYYGTSLQPGFNPSHTYPEIARVYAAGDYATAMNQIWAALAKDPTNLYLLFTGYGAASSLGNEEAKTLLQSRLLQVCDLIFLTGAGVTQESPYIVLRPSDIDEFVVKYMQPASINGRARIANLEAIRVTLDGVGDDVILYFRTY